MDRKMRAEVRKKAMVLLAVLLAALLPAGSGKAEAASQKQEIKTDAFVELMVKTAGIPVDKTRAEPYRTAALEGGLIQEGEVWNWKENITNADAAVLASRADELLHGTKYDEALYDKIVDKKRILDLGGIPKEKQPAAVRMFLKGIMIGSGNGKCAQSRSFDGSSPLPASAAKLIAERVKNPSKRRSLSPDGQLIRTTNLPKNAKDYEYVLESFPNSFYEAPFEYKRNKYYYEPVELEDYASPARMKRMMFDTKQGLTMEEVTNKYLELWCDKIEKNMTLRFNADYRTIDNAWVNDLRSTYYVFGDAEADREKTNYIKQYVKEMKRNKVIVEASKVVAEPSSLYYDNSKCIRVYVRFRVVSGPVKKVAGMEKNAGVDLADLFYCSSAYVEGYRKGQWLERYFDIDMGTVNMGSDGSDYAVYGSSLADAQRELVKLR